MTYDSSTNQTAFIITECSTLKSHYLIPHQRHSASIMLWTMSSAFQMSVWVGVGGRSGISAADLPLDVILKHPSMILGIKVP